MFNDFNSGIINSRPYLHKIPIKFWNVKSEFIPFSSLFDFGTSFWSYHKIFEIPEKNDNCTITSIKKVEDNLMLWFSKIPKEVSQSRKIHYPKNLINKNFFSTINFESFVIRRVLSSDIKGYYTLLQKDCTIPQFVLMVKKTHINYVRLCVLLNEPILEDCFEFWYNKSISIPVYKRILKEMLIELTSIDIPCIGFESSDALASKLFYNIEIKANSIKEQKQYFVDLSETIKKEYVF